MRPVEELQQVLGYRFRRRELLEQALTHSSFAHEQSDEASGDNERLEFLGDSVLGFVISDALYQALPGLQEGQLSKLRAYLVSSANLLQYAERLGLGECLRLGRGEEKTGGRRKQALLVNAFEAVLAAVYLDGGIEPARVLALELFGPQIDKVGEIGKRVPDFKTALQERLQGRGRRAAEYRLVGEAGPDHERLFTVEVRIDGGVAGTGIGLSRKAAEQAAAMEALEALGRGDHLARTSRQP